MASTIGDVGTLELLLCVFVMASTIGIGGGGSGGCFRLLLLHPSVRHGGGDGIHHRYVTRFRSVSSLGLDGLPGGGLDTSAAVSETGRVGGD